MNAKMITRLFGAVCSVSMLVAAVEATAIPTTVDSSYLLGTVDPGSPSSSSDELARLNNLVNAYNGTPPGTYNPVGLYLLNPGVNVPAAPLPLGVTHHGKVPGSGTSQLISLGANQYDWLMGKWANVVAYYYIGNLSGDLELVNDVVFNQNDEPQSLSHYVLFNERQTRVPDGGATIALLGLGLVGLGGLSRRRRG